MDVACLSNFIFPDTAILILWGEELSFNLLIIQCFSVSCSFPHVPNL
jgi:hypothetical protein